MSKSHPNERANQKMTPELIEHIGWDLWRVTQGWKQRFNAEMVALGFAWFGEGRGNLIQHIGRKGVPQNELVLRAGMTKQAVQQHLDDLVSDGAVERISDPNDARKKLVRFTDIGFEALTASNVVKRAIEADYQDLIGKSAMEELKRSLQKISVQQSGADK